MTPPLVSEIPTKYIWQSVSLQRVIVRFFTHFANSFVGSTAVERLDTWLSARQWEFSEWDAVPSCFWKHAACYKFFLQRKAFLDLMSPTTHGGFQWKLCWLWLFLSQRYLLKHLGSWTVTTVSWLLTDQNTLARSLTNLIVLWTWNMLSSLSRESVDTVMLISQYQTALINLLAQAKLLFNQYVQTTRNLATFAVISLEINFSKWHPSTCLRAWVPISAWDTLGWRASLQPLFLVTSWNSREFPRLAPLLSEKLPKRSSVAKPQLQ